MQLISGQPQRSFNHHLSLGGGEPPVCDRGLRAGWFRFDSPAGSLMPTECPGGNYCGTHMPVWMKGEWMYEENMPFCFVSHSDETVNTHTEISFIICAPGLVKFVPAVAYLLRLALPGSFLTMFCAE